MGAVLLIGARLLQFSGALALLGGSLFILYVFVGWHGHAAWIQPRWARTLVLAAAITGLLGTTLWIMAEAAVISEDVRKAFDPEMLWTIATATRFGNAALLRAVLLGVSAAIALAASPRKSLWFVHAALGAAASATFAWTGHGTMDTAAAGLTHLSADVLHLLVAAVWLGALPMLVFLVRDALDAPSNYAAHLALEALDRFSAVGGWTVALLGISGLVNAWFLIGRRPLSALFGTPYGNILLVKLVLFATMLGLAALHRYRSVPALRATLQNASTDLGPTRGLHRTLAAETALGLLVLLAVSVMGTLAPPASGD